MTHQLGSPDDGHDSPPEPGDAVEALEHSRPVRNVHELVERPHQHHDEHTGAQREQGCRNSVPMLAVCFALYLLRDLDTRWTVGPEVA